MSLWHITLLLFCRHNNQVRGVYSRVARRASLLFEASKKLAGLSNFYQPSIFWFTQAVRRGIESAPLDGIVENRILNLLNKITGKIFTLVCMGENRHEFEHNGCYRWNTRVKRIETVACAIIILCLPGCHPKHHLVFAFHAAVAASLEDKDATEQEIAFLLADGLPAKSGEAGQEVDDREEEDRKAEETDNSRGLLLQWMTPRDWERVKKLEALSPPFSGLLNSVLADPQVIFHSAALQSALPLHKTVSSISTPFMTLPHRTGMSGQ